jgi:hypothetical protein
MAKGSFWEKLGRGVGRGLQKTKAWSEQVASEGESRSELEKAEKALQHQYQALGQLVADELLAGEREALPLDSPEAKEIIGAIREQRDLVERLRKEEEQASAQDEEAAADGDARTTPAPEDRGPSPNL